MSLMYLLKVSQLRGVLKAVIESLRDYVKERVCYFFICLTLHIFYTVVICSSSSSSSSK